MFINAHCHVFNLPSLYSSSTLQLLEDRLRESPLSTAMQGILLGLVKVLVHRLESSPPATLNDLPDRLRVLLAESYDKVADQLLKAVFQALGPSADPVFTPLMMDFVSDQPGDVPGDINRFDTQLADTKRQMLRYPGRMLPFVAVNALRTGPAFPAGQDAVTRMKDAVENRGFVGVKLYPTLGYTIKDLETCGDGGFFQYVDQKALPITMHTNPEGSRLRLEYWQYCQPSFWRPYLEQYHNFRINFAHMGGGNCFRQYVDGAESVHFIWREQIFGLMKDFPERVFADLSYHSLPWKRSLLSYTHRDGYFRSLNQALDKPAYAGNILFGTDFPLNLMTTSEQDYLTVFQEHLGDHFQAVTDDNPRRFLGLGSKDGVRPHRENILRHVEFLKQERAGAEQTGIWTQGSLPASWVQELLQA